MLLVFLAISLSQAHEFVSLKEVQKYYFDDKEMSEMQFTLYKSNVTILFISVSVLLSALYSVCYSILSNYSEISENVTKEIVRSSRLNLFGTEASNKLKQFNVNVQSELTNDNTTTPASDSYSSSGSGSAATECVNDYTHSSSSKVNNTAQQENTNTAYYINHCPY